MKKYKVPILKKLSKIPEKSPQTTSALSLFITTVVAITHLVNYNQNSNQYFTKMDTPTVNTD